MKLANLIFREKTNVTTTATVVFNASGTYYPPYGKTTFLLQGQGTPGNYSSGGNYAGNNTVPGNAGVYVAATGGNASTNPATPASPKSPTPGTIITAYVDPSYCGGGPAYSYTNVYPGTNSAPPSYNGTVTCSPAGGYLNINYSVDGYTTIPGSGFNPYVAGNTYYNPVTPAYTDYNQYNPTTPGSPYYNPYYPGSAGPTNNVLGVTLPGGPSDSTASVVGYVPVSIPYSSAGIAITVPSGGYVKIQNL